MTSVYTQTAQALFDDFQTYISRHGMISGCYGDVLYSVGFCHRELVAHGTTLAELSRLFANVGMSFTYFYIDEDGVTEDQIALNESPYYGDVHISTQKVNEVPSFSPSDISSIFHIQEVPVSPHTQIAEQIFESVQQLFGIFLSYNSRQGKFSYSGSYGDLLRLIKFYNLDSAAHGTTLSELGRLFKEIDVSFMYCYGDEDGHATEQQIALTDTADYEDVYISLSC